MQRVAKNRTRVESVKMPLSSYYIYWERVPYKGFGVGACSCDGNVLTQNSKNLLNYLKEIRNTGRGVIFSEALKWLERLMLNLRQRGGSYVADNIKLLAPQKKEEFSRKSHELLSALLSVSDRKMMLAPEELSVANEVIVRLACI